MALVIDNAAPNERKPAPAPEPKMPTSMALVLSKYQTLVAAQNEDQGRVLFCQSPHCANTHDRKIDGGFAYTCKPCDQTVEVEVGGETVTRYRFKEDDEIYLGCRGAKTNDGEQQIQGCIVCAACHYADPVPMHQGITGECLCCSDAGINQPDAAAGGRRGRQNKPKSRADEFGPRLRQLEALNRSTYQSEAKMEEIKEESNELLRAHETEGGAAQRRAEMARRKAERQAKREAECVERQAEQTAVLQSLLDEQEKLDRLEAGMTLGQDEEDTSVDARGEDMHAAAAQFDREGSVPLLREAFPLSALRWYGPEPTDDEIEAQRAVVEAAANARDAAAAKYELVLAEAEASDGEPGEDYDDAKAKAEAEAKASGKGKGKGKRKSIVDMSEAELAAHTEKQAKAKAKARKTNDEKKMKVDAYEGLMITSGRYDRAKVKIHEQNNAIETMQEDIETMKRATLKKEAQQRAEKEVFVAWLNSPGGKPEGWDAEEASADWRAFATAHRAKLRAKGARGNGGD